MDRADVVNIAKIRDHLLFWVCIEGYLVSHTNAKTTHDSTLLQRSSCVVTCKHSKLSFFRLWFSVVACPITRICLL